jgi:CxxC motif-containing protein (DUF1111 family)
MIRSRVQIRMWPIVVVLSGIVMVAQQTAVDAPAGFDTPTLARNQGSQSTSNGIPEPPGDTYALDQQAFENAHDPSTGLGPVFNARACVDCHQNPVSGSGSQFTEVRVGHRDINGNFVNPTVTINNGAATITGRSIIDERATCAEAQERIPDSEDIRTLRSVLSALGDGFVEAIDDNTLLAIAERQPSLSRNRIHGQAILVPILEAPGTSRVGRFGWKDQHGSLLSFSGDAYLNEMGVTNRLRPKDITSVCKTATDPEDTPDNIGMEDIDHFAQFMRGTKAPPRDAALIGTPAVVSGEAIFNEIGCAICHVSSIITAPAGAALNGGKFIVPEALGNKIIHPFSDFLLHDVGTGDGIVQVGPQETANKLRTSALWGLRTRSRFMHDLASLTLENAILRHRGEAATVTRHFRELGPDQKHDLLSFLNSL